MQGVGLQAVIQRDVKVLSEADTQAVMAYLRLFGCAWPAGLLRCLAFAVWSECCKAVSGWHPGCDNSPCSALQHLMLCSWPP